MIHMHRREGGGSGSKGISPLLATVLLVAATVVITTMLSGWVSTTMTTTQNTVSNRTTEGVACVAAEIVIDDVYSSAGDNSSAYAIVRNSGWTDNLAIISAQLYDKLGNNLSTITSLPINLNKGQMTTLAFASNKTVTAKDASSLGNNGTLGGNNVDWILSGRFGSAVNFVHSYDYISVPNHNAYRFDFLKNFSISFWINPSPSQGSSSNSDVLNKFNGFTDMLRMVMTLNGQAVSFSYSRGDGSLAVRNSVSMVTNSWNNVVLVNDRTQNFPTFYVNGVSGTEVIDSTNTSRQLNMTNSAAWYIGSDPSAYFSLVGSLDEFMIWNRTLTAAEILGLNGSNSMPSNTNDLILYLKLDEGRGIIACPSDFSRVVVTTNCGGVSAEFSKTPKC